MIRKLSQLSVRKVSQVSTKDNRFFLVKMTLVMIVFRKCLFSEQHFAHWI